MEKVLYAERAYNSACLTEATEYSSFGTPKTSYVIARMDGTKKLSVQWQMPQFKRGNTAQPPPLNAELTPGTALVPVETSDVVVEYDGVQCIIWWVIDVGYQPFDVTVTVEKAVTWDSNTGATKLPGVTRKLAREVGFIATDGFVTEQYSELFNALMKKHAFLGIPNAVPVTAWARPRMGKGGGDRKK